MTKIPFSILLLFSSLVVAGCGDGKARHSADGNGLHNEKPTASNETETRRDGFPFTIKDRLARKQTLEKSPERIVSLSPRNTELLFAIRAGQQVVGVTSYCDYPPEVKKRQQVGGFSSSSLSIENLVSLKPDLVVSGGEIHKPVILQLERLGIPVVALEAESLDDLYGDIRLLGRITNHEAEATRLVEDMQARMAAVAAKINDVSPQERVTVFYQIWDEPLTAAGPACFVGQMIEHCGGINVIADTSARYPQISEEVLLESNPKVILSATMTGKPITRQHFMAKPAWHGVAAVKNNRIHIIDGNLISRFGPRIVDAVEAMARSLYPRRFAKDSHASTGSLPVHQGPME